MKVYIVEQGISTLGVRLTQDAAKALAEEAVSDYYGKPIWWHEPYACASWATSQGERFTIIEGTYNDGPRSTEKVYVSEWEAK